MKFARVLLFFVLMLSWPGQVAAQGENAPVIALRIEGALHPAMDEHLKRAIQQAERSGAQLIVLELDTPGGSIDLMNGLMEQIRGSSIPIVVYVTPRGAMAASAGALITIAGHAAAMAPETTIGAASPVDSSGGDIGETMENKVKEMLKANVRTMVTNRPEEARQLAEEMIDSARAVSVDEALEIGLIDYKATSREDLLRQMDGTTIQVSGSDVSLATASAPVIEVPVTFLENLLMVLANPNIAFLLLAIGIQAILIEMGSPGGWVAGFVGVVCLLFAIYGMGLLPVNWFGALFMIMSIVLFVLEIKTPTFGALTAAGVGAFIIGALVLFNSPNVPSFQRVSIPLVVGTGIGLGAVFFLLVGIALRAQRNLPSMGVSTMIGEVGVVTTPLNPTGTVQLGSELWSAVLEDDETGSIAQRGERVVVTGMERLNIRVRKQPHTKP